MKKNPAPVASPPDPRTRLLALPDSADLGPHEVAALLSCCIDHLGRLVRRGNFPRPHRLGNLRRWKLGDVRRHLADAALAAQAAGRG